MVADEWKENFRMSKRSLFALCEELHQYISKSTARFLKSASAGMQVAVTIYCLSDEGKFSKTANAFRITKNTVSMIIRRVTKAISNHLADRCIKLPRTEEEVNESSSLFF